MRCEVRTHLELSDIWFSSACSIAFEKSQWPPAFLDVGHTEFSFLLDSFHHSPVNAVHIVFRYSFHHSPVNAVHIVFRFPVFLLSVLLAPIFTEFFLVGLLFLFATPVGIGV